MSEKKEKEKRRIDRMEQSVLAAIQKSPGWRESSFWWGLLGLGVALMMWATEPTPGYLIFASVLAWLCFSKCCWGVFYNYELKRRCIYTGVASLVIAIFIYKSSEIALTVRLSIESNKEFYTVPQDNQPFPPKVSRYAKIKVTNTGKRRISHVSVVVTRVNNQDELLHPPVQLPLSSIDNQLDLPNSPPMVTSTDMNPGDERGFDALVECNGYAGCPKGNLVFPNIENGRRRVFQLFGKGYSRLEEFTVRASGDVGAPVTKTFVLLLEPNGKLQLKSKVDEEAR